MYPSSPELVAQTTNPGGRKYSIGYSTITEADNCPDGCISKGGSPIAVARKEEPFCKIENGTFQIVNR